MDLVTLITSHLGLDIKEKKITLKEILPVSICLFSIYSILIGLYYTLLNPFYPLDIQIPLFTYILSGFHYYSYPYSLLIFGTFIFLLNIKFKTASISIFLFSYTLWEIVSNGFVISSGGLIYFNTFIFILSCFLLLIQYKQFVFQLSLPYFILYMLFGYSLISGINTNFSTHIVGYMQEVISELTWSLFIFFSFKKRNITNNKSYLYKANDNFI